MKSVQQTGRALRDEIRVKWAAFGFLLFVLAYESYVVKVGYSDYLIFLMDTQSLSDGLLLCSCIAISHYIFYRMVVVSFISSSPLKFTFFVLFTCAVVIEYGYQKALGRFSGSFDIGNAVATTGEQKIASLLLYANPSAVVPCAIFLALLLIVKGTRLPKKALRYWSTLVLTLVFFLGTTVLGAVFIEKPFPMLSLNAFLRTGSDFLYWGAFAGGNFNQSFSRVSRRKISQPALAEEFQPPNNIILVIDESVRADHLSLNGYSRKTTPFLEQLNSQGVLHSWGIAVSASTGSRFTYNSLIAGLQPDDFPDKTEFKIRSHPTLFQYAKAMRYKTHFFDGQMNVFWGANGEDLEFIDEWHGIEELSNHGFIESYEIDNQIAKQAKSIISKSTGNFIVIFKHGSHIPYQINFPSKEAKWVPSYNAENKFAIPDSSLLDEVINAYDNSLRYNIDSFFINLVDDYKKIPNHSVILYTGDHGQTLFANGKASHGGSTKVEAAVPLFIIGELNRDIDMNYKASHQNLFPTILDLMNYPVELRDHRSSISLLKATASDSAPRFFNPDLDQKVPFD